MNDNPKVRMIGTIGHIDRGVSGKTSLIAALMGSLKNSSSEDAGKVSINAFDVSSLNTDDKPYGSFKR